MGLHSSVENAQALESALHVSGSWYHFQEESMIDL